MGWRHRVGATGSFMEAQMTSQRECHVARIPIRRIGSARFIRWRDPGKPEPLDGEKQERILALHSGAPATRGAGSRRGGFPPTGTSRSGACRRLLGAVACPTELSTSWPLHVHRAHRHRRFVWLVLLGCVHDAYGRRLDTDKRADQRHRCSRPLQVLAQSHLPLNAVSPGGHQHLGEQPLVLGIGRRFCCAALAGSDLARRTISGAQIRSGVLVVQDACSALALGESAGLWPGRGRQ